MTMGEAELIVERRRLQRRLRGWRIAAILLLVGAIAAFVGWGGGYSSDPIKWRDHIARVRIDGMITGDRPTLDLLADIAKSDKVKAVILRIDSPGGTTAGSEALYEALRKLGKDKPIVAVMDTVAASGGYITAIAADHIVARGNTITGSIGVIFQFPEVSKLLDTLGIKMEEIKSGDLKAEPSPYKPVSEKARAVANEMVQDAFAWFTGLVAERRKLPIERVRFLADGRVYTGRQALTAKLVDELGGEEEAVAWLSVTAKIPKTTGIADWSPRRSSGVESLGFSAIAAFARAIGLETAMRAADHAALDGLLVIWHPDL
jgi:protease IV